MKDYSSTYQRKKIAPNKVKVQKKPRDLKKYLRPLARYAGILASATIGIALLYGAYRALGSVTLFRVATIDVSNAKRLSREDILAISGVEAGRDLLRLNLKQVGEQLTRNPWVERVHVRRYLPDTLSISVTEREPLAIVSMDFLYYLDTRGTVFKPLNQGDRLDYPVVTGFREDELAGDPAGSREALRSTCELIQILREKGAFILADVSEIHYDKGYGFTLFTASGALPVKVGSGDFAAKIERFARIYRDLMAQRPSLQYIDLDYNDKIVIKKS